MYYFVEKSIAILKPKQPLLDWLYTIYPEDDHSNLNLESIRIDCNSYLIPEVEEIEDGVKFIDEKFADLFAIELSTWTEDESKWPSELTLKLFWEWFEVEILPSLIDLSENEGSEDIEDLRDNTIH